MSLASGLKVNFSKSNILGINVNSSFLSMAEGFLHCKIGAVPFKYLGLLVGANPRRVATGEPLVGLLLRRIGYWKNRFISFGGRITLLNSVLNSLPIFFLSYFKMWVGVWKKLVRLQREFLWGGCSDRKKIPWVRWSEVCKPNDEGGLGVKDLRSFNLILLGKWRWRLLVGNSSIWQDVLVARYGQAVASTPVLSSLTIPSFASSWWKDICRMGMESGSWDDWFNNNTVRRVGNGFSTSFWHDTWVELFLLVGLFPRLFLVSNRQEACVGDFGR